MIATGTSIRGRGELLRGLGTGILGALLWSIFAIEHVRVFLHTGRVVGIGLALIELFAAALFIVRRAPERSSERPVDWTVALVGTFGVLVVLAGLGALGRSFGLVAAHRDLVMTGPYRVVRHPLYAAYTILQVGYLLQSLRLWNVVVLGVVWACQVARIRAEERLLREDAGYARYTQHTRFRLVPGIW